jgi:hypothetical protein
MQKEEEEEVCVVPTKSAAVGDDREATAAWRRTNSEAGETDEGVYLALGD